jgi:hypothetical protein
MALPDMSVSGLSRKLGNVAGDLAQLAKEQFDPFQYFPSAKLLGKLDLKQVVKAAIGDATIPKFISDIQYPALPSLSDLQAKIPQEIKSRIDWKPDVQEAGFFKPLGDSKRTLELFASTRLVVATGKSEYQVRAKLTDFAVVIGSFLEVQFAQCTFESGSGRPTKCDPKIKEVLFKGPLAFVQKLQEKLGNLFGDGFKVAITPQAVDIGLSFELAPMTFGVFAIMGLSFKSGVSLPLLGGQPMSFFFRFADRANPFILSVGIFGGTGFFAIELQTGDLSGPGSCVRRIEAALEFGGFLALNLGVASGSVAVMGGIYYRWERTEVAFSGYLRITGHMSVLGIVSVTVEFLLTLVYTRSGEGSYAEGSAQISVRIKIGFFKKTFRLRAHRRFAGSGGTGSPNGADALPPGGCRSIAELEEQAQRTLDSPRGSRIEDEMTPQHFNTYWSAFDFASA